MVLIKTEKQATISMNVYQNTLQPKDATRIKQMTFCQFEHA